MRGDTGGCMMFSWWLIHAKLSKQKFNTKTQPALKSLDPAITSNLVFVWIFIWNIKGIKLKKTLMQDNMSAFKMENNGWNLCRVNSQHINIRYFFVKDMIDKKENEIVHCPTEIMLDN